MVSGHTCEEHESPHSCLHNKRKAEQSEGSQLFLDASEN